MPSTQKSLVTIFAKTKSTLPLHGFARSDDGAFRFRVSEEEAYSPCDVAVLYGSRPMHVATASDRLRRAIYRAHKGPVVVMETGFTGREVRARDFRTRMKALLRARGKAFSSVHAFYRVGIGGAFGDDADFCNENSPADRWVEQASATGTTLEPYRKTGKHVLLVCQVPLDDSLRRASMTEWIGDSARKIRSLTDRPIHVRLHPGTDFSFVSETESVLMGIRKARLLPIRGKPIAEDLRNCWACVTYSSSSAIDALIAGVPPICMSPASIAFGLCSNSLQDVNAPLEPKREAWFRDLAYAQWSIEEIEQGRPWMHLRDRVGELLRAKR